MAPWYLFKQEELSKQYFLSYKSSYSTNNKNQNTKTILKDLCIFLHKQGQRQIQEESKRT